MWNRLFPKRIDRGGHLLNVDESDSLIMSLGFSILFFSILVTFGWFNIPDPIFLATAVFALYFSLAMSFKNSTFKTIFLVLTFPVTTYCVFIIQELTTDLNRVNNGLSLFALSFSLLFMPLKKLEEKTSKKIEKFSKDTIDVQQKHIKLLKERNELLSEENKGFREDVKKLKFEVDKLQSEIATLSVEELDEFSKETQIQNMV